MSIDFLTLTAYGDQIELKPTIDSKKFVRWTEDNFKYVRYNPRHDVNRWGLSITSLDGGLSGIPDLDSLHQYNIENNTSHAETDFDVITQVYEQYNELQKIIEPWKDYMFRSHVIRLGPGGFFPPHRDTYHYDINTFRLIVPLHNCNPPNVFFNLEENVMHWEQGRMYFLNTTKVHTLFNASFDNSYWIVFNIKCNKDSVNAVLRNLKQT